MSRKPSRESRKVKQLEQTRTSEIFLRPNLAGGRPFNNVCINGTCLLTCFSSTDNRFMLTHLVYPQLWTQLFWLWNMCMQMALIINDLIYLVPRANSDKLFVMIISFIQVSILGTIQLLQRVQVYKCEQYSEQNYQIYLCFLKLFISLKLIFFFFPISLRVIILY